MNISIHFPDEIESALRDRAAATGKDVETLVTELVTEQLLVEQCPAKEVISPEAFAERSAAWIGLHPILDHPIDDSRESIYAGRGE